MNNDNLLDTNGKSTLGIGLLIIAVCTILILLLNFLGQEFNAGNTQPNNVVEVARDDISVSDLVTPHKAESTIKIESGRAVIPKGSNQVKVLLKNASEQIPSIQVTPVNYYGAYTLANVESNSFMISIPSVAAQELELHWVAIF